MSSWRSGVTVSSKPSKKRSDFKSAAEYKRWRNRSIASKKVWRERKQSALRSKIEAVDTSTPIRGLDGLTVKQLEAKLAESERRRMGVEAQLAAEILTRGFVDSEDVEKLHKDMTIALMPSRLRHMGAVTDEMEKMLKKAHKKGERALRKQAKEYASFFAVPLREVYTLFFSP